MEVLPLDSETRRRLELLGLRRMGQIALLPRPALIAQFGRIGSTMHRLAKFIPERIKQAGMGFDPPVEDRQILLNVVCKLAGDLAKRLEADNLTCSDITLTVHLHGGRAVEARRQVSEPISGALPLYRLCQTLLDRLTIQQEMVDISVQLARLAPVKPRQLSLFDWGAKRDLQEVLINLSERYGEERFHRVMLNEKISYLPELGFHRKWWDKPMLWILTQSDQLAADLFIGVKMQQPSRCTPLWDDTDYPDENDHATRHGGAGHH